MTSEISAVIVAVAAGTAEFLPVLMAVFSVTVEIPSVMMPVSPALTKIPLMVGTVSPVTLEIPLATALVFTAALDSPLAIYPIIPVQIAFSGNTLALTPVVDIRPSVGRRISAIDSIRWKTGIVFFVSLISLLSHISVSGRAITGHRDVFSQIFPSIFSEQRFGIGTSRRTKRQGDQTDQNCISHELTLLFHENVRALDTQPNPLWNCLCSI